MDDFIHIPKTSGSSLRTVLSRQYGGAQIAYFEPGNPSLKGRDAVVALREDLRARNVRLVTGHHAFGLHALIAQPLRYFSMVRDPISRAASDYFFAYSYEHHRLRSEILSGALTAESFLIEGKGAGPFDLQCRLVKGSGRAEENAAESAFETVERCFVAVGVTEQFDESLILLAKRLGWDPPLYATRNVTRLPAEIEAKRRRCEELVRDQFAERYAADLQLHNQVKIKLLDNIGSEGASFAHALEAFREMQAAVERANLSARYYRYEFAATDRAPDLPSIFKGSEPYRTLEDYLRASAQPVRTHNYIGHVDLKGRRVVGGWAADLNSGKPIEVRVYCLGRCVGAAIARDKRPDVESALGIRNEVGFKVQLEDDLPESEADSWVCFEDSGIRI